ncbi:MAG: bifunctional 3'-5' exonuclease/DNA polymerase [Actinomycetota bacterium]
MSVPCGTICSVRVAVVAGPDRSALLCELDEDGTKCATPVTVNDLCSAVADYERSGPVRWVWASTAALYPALLRAGQRVDRCHDVELTERLLISTDGTPSEGAEALAPERAASTTAQGMLFDPADATTPDPAAAMAALITVHAAQLRRIAADQHPARFAMLVAAESAGGLVAAEMTFAGLPWRADVHNSMLSDMLGARPPAMPAGGRPARLAELAARIEQAFGGRRVNPDSPAQLVRAFGADGIRITSTRSAVLREVDHPAAAALLEYKELARLHAAHGWAWLDSWVSGGRFRPEYVVGGVVSGRWASRGGGALQIPRVLRRAVVADPGWVLVVADAAQLEPRVLAALAGDRAFAEAAASGDLYLALAKVFGGERDKAKIALLSAMYGGGGGEAGQLLAVLRQRFPLASAYVETAARAGEEGRVVRSVLGRTCPPPSAAWRAITEESWDPEISRDPSAGAASRARGRFTRNFVVQASAADWALALLASLRRRLTQISILNGNAPVSPGASSGNWLAPDLPGSGSAAGSGSFQSWSPSAVRVAEPHLVFFQHDEVIVHCPEAAADQVVAAIGEAGEEAGRLVFGATPVRFPLTTAVVRCYADAK